MKHLLKIILFLLPGFVFSQDVIFNSPSKKQVDSLRLVLPHAANDSSKMKIYRKLGSYYVEINIALAKSYFTKEISLTRKLTQKLWEAESLLQLSYIAYEAGNYPQSLKLANAGIKITENEDCEKGVWRITEFAKDGDAHKARLYLLAALNEKLGYLYVKTGNKAGASSYFKAIKIAMDVEDKVGLSFYNEDLGDYYLEQNKLDSALYFTNRALEYVNSSGYKLYQGALLANLGQIYLRKGDYAAATKYYYQSIAANKEQNNQRYLAKAYILLADLYRSTGKSDSGIYYGRLALKAFKAQGDRPGSNEAYNSIFAGYKLQGQTDSAFVYLQRSKILGDSLNEAEKTKLSQFLGISFNEQLNVQKLEKEKIEVQTKIRTYVLLAGIFIILLIALLLYRNNRSRRKASAILQQEKEKVESMLDQLKATQTQLIQSEKMASLGELTAGIAHEIQNPLNFVNNFSEVNTELIDEMQLEIDKGDFEEVKAIANDIKENQQKINQHGKRADFIVKGMLQHSRTSTGEKQLTNANLLADEFLKLSYHGLRAKDKSFNAELVTNFDESLPKINVVQQDIGRVLLNLFNNAFYAVNQKQKTAGPDYKPTVTVTTFTPPSGGWGAKVGDNGIGIPDAIKDKIMQPFFTTKPTGEGTGLGLSLSYDIVVKGHGGRLEVTSEEGKYTEFKISIPI